MTASITDLPKRQPCPPLTDTLIAFMDQMWPEECAHRDMSLFEIGERRGARDVVLWFKQELEAQKREQEAKEVRI